MYTPPVVAESIKYVKLCVRVLAPTVEPKVPPGRVTILELSSIDRSVKSESETKVDIVTVQVKLAGPPLAADTDDNETLGAGTIK